MNEAHNQDPYQGLEQNPQLVASEQIRVAEVWARIYADPNNTSKSAEFVLRNPKFYFEQEDVSHLPEDLQQGWKKAEDFAKFILDQGHPDLGPSNSSSIGRIQNLVHTGEMSSMFRGSVADLMRISSGLFSESVKHIPGNTRYYAGNILGAEGALKFSA